MSSQSDSLDLFKDRVILRDSHREQFLAPVLFIQDLVRMLLEFLHMSPDEHLPQLDKVAVLLVVDLDRAPRVRASAHLATVRGRDDLVGPDDRERDLAL